MAPVFAFAMEGLTAMIARRLVLLGATLAATISLAACSQLSQNVPGNSGVVISHNYTAFGASDAVGVGASVMCDPNGLVAIPTCPGGTGYVPDIANVLAQPPGRVNLNDLGISGAVVGPNVKAVLLSCPAFASQNPNLHDFVSDELPNYPVGQNLVTIFAGGNDVKDLFTANALLACNLNTTTYFNAFGADFTTLLTQVHALNPLAHIVVADLPNLGLIPLGVCLGAPLANPPPFCTASDPPGNNPLAQAGLGQLAEALDTLVYSGIFSMTNIPMVDLLCNPNSYNPANFSPDGFHPDDAGYALLAQNYLFDINALAPPAPSFTCPQATTFAIAKRQPWSAMRGVRIPKD
jgi:lysophospholipase L1-like esterase